MNKNINNITIDICRNNNINSGNFTPEDILIKNWINLTLSKYNKNLNQQIELCVTLTDNTEIQQLNKQYRHKNKPTNVLAFPLDLPNEINLCHLGDIICSVEYINNEAKQLNIENLDHWAHIIIHGTLHLLGYDHINNNDASKMETAEINILKQLNFANPYVA